MSLLFDFDEEQDLVRSLKERYLGLSRMNDADFETAIRSIFLEIQISGVSKDAVLKVQRAQVPEHLLNLVWPDIHAKAEALARHSLRNGIVTTMIAGLLIIAPALDRAGLLPVGTAMPEWIRSRWLLGIAGLLFIISFVQVIRGAAAYKRLRQ